MPHSPRRLGCLLLNAIAAWMMLMTPCHAHDDAARWVTAWTASVHGPYPAGNPSAQPDLRLAFPSPEKGAHDQSFRLILKPSLWGKQVRVRFSNAFGNRPIDLDAVYLGLQWSAAALVPGSNVRVRFRGQTGVRIPAGQWIWSDPVDLTWLENPDDVRYLGRKLAVSFHITGESGPMTWHAKALQTSYLSFPGRNSHAGEEDEAGFPIPTTSWYFVDAIDVKASAATFAVVCFGDSITDGTLSTLNGDDRWPDVLLRQLQRRLGNRIAVLNAGIGGNQIAGPARYDLDKPHPGGPAAGQRLERDVLSLSGVGAVIWLEGINDFSRNGSADAARAIEEMRAGVRRMREAIPGVRVIGATLPPALGTNLPAHGSGYQETQRRALNEFIRSGKAFDAVVDFDRIIGDPDTGAMRAPYVHNTTVGGEGDKLHPNRLGYLAMGLAVQLESLLPPASASSD